MKTCTNCKVEKNESEFSRCGPVPPRSDQLKPRCNACICLARREHYWKDPEKSRKQQRDWIASHPEYSPPKNPKANCERSRRYRLRHPTAWKDRYNSDATFRVTTILRSRIRKALNWSGVNKSETTKALIGCPVVWLEAHLESLFKPGMMWENQGSVWHIDHIKPCAKFDLTDPEQQRICFNWTNLQPLFAKDNISKGARYHG